MCQLTELCSLAGTPSRRESLPGRSRCNPVNHSLRKQFVHHTCRSPCRKNLVAAVGFEVTANAHPRNPRRVMAVDSQRRRDPGESFHRTRTALTAYCESQQRPAIENHFWQAPHSNERVIDGLADNPGHDLTRP